MPRGDSLEIALPRADARLDAYTGRKRLRSPEARSASFPE
jgi:hypothetical protein